MARAAQRGLDENDVATLRGALADGGTPTVWFTAAAVGVKVGGSAKVLELTVPAEGDFIRVRPAGSADELSFGAAELTTTRPARAAKAAPEPVKSEPKKRPAGTAAAGTAPARSAPPAPTERPARVGSAAAQPGTPAAAPATTAPATTAPATTTPAAAPAPRRRTGQAARQAPVTTVTLTSTSDGEWTADVHIGKKRTVRALGVPASSVLAAAKSLGDEVSTAIDTAISEARDRQQAEVQRLRDQLAAAERALDDLSG